MNATDFGVSPYAVPAHARLRKTGHFRQLLPSAISSLRIVCAQTTRRCGGPKAAEKCCNRLNEPVFRNSARKSTGEKAAGFLCNCFHQRDYGVRKNNPLLKQELRPEAAKSAQKDERRLEGI